MAVLLANDDEIIRLQVRGDYHRPCGLARHRRSITVRFCLCLVLFCASFVVGIFLGRNRHAHQVSSTGATPRSHRISFHEDYELPSSVLIVGGAGFIGMHAALRLQTEGVEKVVVVDSFNDKHYSSKLKEERASVIENKGINVTKGDACDMGLIQRIIADNGVQGIIYLASQSYLRNDFAVKRPFQYPPDNMDCIVSILDALRAIGKNDIPFVYTSDTAGFKLNLASEAGDSDNLDEEIEEHLRYNEMISRAYYKLYGVSSVGVRFGTTIGTFGRPDMSYCQDAKATRTDKRTYHSVDDIVREIMIELGSFAAGFNIVTLPRHNMRAEDEAMDEFLKWYDEGGSKFALEEKSMTTQKPREVANQICFVTSLFSDNPKLIEREGPYPVANYTNSHSTFKYYYFTNVDPDGLPSNGWEIIQLQEMNFERYITKSRWPKFMGFRHRKLQSCKAIIYSDANRPPKDLKYAEWKGLVEKVLESKDGIMQDRRPSKETIFDEMHSIVARDKDIAANIDASKKWFLEQNDFHNDAPGWWNMALIMDPSNARLQELLTTLWAHYSQELLSWRDQPLWRYLVDKLDMEPLDLRLEGGHSKFFARVKSSGKHHHYDANTNGVSWQ